MSGGSVPGDVNDIVPDMSSGVLSSAGPRRARGPRRRLIIDNDWAGDPDGLVALAHHLLSTDRVDAVTSSLTSPMFPGSDSGAARGLVLAEELTALIAPSSRPHFAAGHEAAGTTGASAASSLIASEARRDDPLPLTIVCAGPLTNVADALRAAPDIATTARLVWVGGAIADVFEYNRETDADAAAFVFASGIAIEQYPLETYRQTTYSIAELEADLGETAVGRLLWRSFTELAIPLQAPMSELWHLGDSLPLLSTSLAPLEHELASGARTVVTDVDMRLLVGDMLAKFRLHERRSQR